MKPSASAKPIQYGPPFNPHKGWVIALLALFVVWMIVLWVMYFKTVYPFSHEPSTTRAVVR
jgi:hypothetical protein